MTADPAKTVAMIMDKHYLSHCVAKPEPFYGNAANGRFWRCACGATGSHVPKGTTIKHAHHLHVAAEVLAVVLQEALPV